MFATILGWGAKYLGGVWGYVAVAVIAAGVAASGSYAVTAAFKDNTIKNLKLADADAKTAAVQAAKDDLSKRDKITLDHAVQEAEAQQKIITNTVTITKEVPIYVTPKSDAACTLPNGFIKLLDAAGLATSPDALPGATSEPNDAPSGISLSEATALLAANLGNGNAEQLKALQSWAAAQAAVH